MPYPNKWAKLPPPPPGVFNGAEPEVARPNFWHAERRNRKLILLLSLCTLVFTCLVVGFTGGTYLRAMQKPGMHGLVELSNTCKHPVLRREWR